MHAEKITGKVIKTIYGIVRKKMGIVGAYNSSNARKFYFMCICRKEIGNLELKRPNRKVILELNWFFLLQIQI